jgi:hypothetical protein
MIHVMPCGRWGPLEITLPRLAVSAQFPMKDDAGVIFLSFR